MSFGNKLRALRKKHKLSQREFAQILGCSKSTISMYENGRRNPSFDNLVKLSELFNDDIKSLLEKNEEGS